MSKDLQKIITDYRANAEKHGDAIIEGDHKIANKSHDKLMKALKKIRKFGDEGDAALLALTENINDSVRCWAATHSLKYDSNKAEKTLTDLMNQIGPIALNAEIVLSEWKKGTLEIP